MTSGNLNKYLPKLPSQIPSHWKGGLQHSDIEKTHIQLIKYEYPVGCITEVEFELREFTATIANRSKTVYCQGEAFPSPFLGDASWFACHEHALVKDPGKSSQSDAFLFYPRR